MKHFSYITLCFILLVSFKKDEIAKEIPSLRTVIVYMAADNDLSEDARDNIRDMQLGFEEKDVNLIVFFDPSNDSPNILQIKKGSSKHIKTYTEFNSCDAAQMGKVLDDIIGMYPSASYGLVMWSHGTSWFPAGSRLKSFGEDNGRQMNINAMASALPVHFDFILMDACLMGSVEVAYELMCKTDFILASSTEIVNTGLPYRQVIPKLLQKEPDLRKVALDFYSFYDQLPGAYRSATISLVDANELEKLATVTGQLIADGASFDRTSVQRLDVYDEQYTFDFLDFMEKAFPEADTVPLKEQLDKTILYKTHTPEFIGEYTISTYCGLSCYIPHQQRNDLNKYYQQIGWNQASGFYRFFK